MKHLLVNKHCDCKYPITWFVENYTHCAIDREYKERHEPTYSGVSISFQSPDDSNYWIEFAANEEGWMYVSDWSLGGKPLPIVPVKQGVKEVEANVDRVVRECFS